MSEELSPTSSRINLANQQTVTDAEGHQVDLRSLSPQELKLYKLYGKLPSKKDLLKHKMQERKYFDSGDYALKKAGVANPAEVSNNNLPVTNPSGLRESIIRRRLSNSAGSVDTSSFNKMERQGSISSGPPPRSPNK
ncbi:phosphatase regulator [Maudiozyma humilis]|uniref:mRNA stability protein n=1 Tax=Maudiozyma humilis TaxID=51915 RepID=A0AAV5RW11_MAUHU|nr:phosphatase regulator [Kazachstania humilis]